MPSDLDQECPGRLVGSMVGGEPEGPQGPESVPGATGREMAGGERVAQPHGGAIMQLTRTGASTANVVDLEAIGGCRVFQAMGREILD